MAYRFTNTDKWNDAWFSDLRPLSKLLFLYLCDQCDIAGFIELNYKKISFELGCGKQEVERSLKEMGDRIVLSIDCKFIFIRHFIKHQRNTDLKETNTAHRGIINRLNDNLKIFDCQTVDDFFKAPLKPLSWGYGIGIGNNIPPTVEKGGMGEKEKTWRESFEIYLSEVSKAYDDLVYDESFIEDRQRYHPNIDIPLSMEKSLKDFWGTEAGWKNKKQSKTKIIDWKSTFKKALDQKFNQVYKQRNEKDWRNQGSIGADSDFARNVAEGIARANYEKQQ